MAFGKKQFSPFDTTDIGKPDFLTEETAEDIRSGKTTSMTRAASVFLICSVISLNFIFISSSFIPVSLLFFLGMVIVWTGTVRFIKKTELMPLVFLLDFALAFAPALTKAYIDPECPVICFIPLATGFMALYVLNGKNGDTAHVTKEIIYPLVISFLVSVPGFMSARLFERTSMAASVLISGLYLIAFSYIISIFTNKQIVFSSDYLSGAEGMAHTRREILDGFAKERTLMLGSVIFAFAVSKIITLVETGTGISLYAYVPLMLCTVMAVVILITAKKDFFRFFPFEAMALCLAVPEFPTVGKTILFIAVDLTVTGLLLTYKRKTVFSERSPFAAGAPLMVIIAGVILMLVDSCLLI
ncbi:MAG: hypothetical protein J5883_03550 [Clostridiales bacterium]|nr:hypothetical protein [Clostridiales bacterium]